MKYAILQMPVSLWHSQNILFTSESVVKHEDYCYVYQGDIPEQYASKDKDLDLCKFLFEQFNIRHPENYAGRSMSGGDIVMVERDQQRTYYLCCSFGWHELINF